MTAWPAGEAEDRKDEKAAIKEALGRRIDGGDDPKSANLGRGRIEVPKIRWNKQ